MNHGMRTGLFAVALFSVTGCTELESPPASGQHCVSNLSTNDSTCFDTFTDAIAFVTGGAITDAPASPSRAFQETDFKARVDALMKTQQATPSPGSQFLVTIHYQDENWTGRSWSWFGDAACDRDPSTMDYSLVGFGNDGENDVLTSFVTFSDCQEILYEHIFFGGISTSLATSYSNLGLSNMNDKASSAKWF